MNEQYKDWVNGGIQFLLLHTPRLACGLWADEPPSLDLQEASSLQSWEGGRVVQQALKLSGLEFLLCPLLSGWPLPLLCPCLSNRVIVVS